MSDNGQPQEDGNPAAVFTGYEPLDKAALEKFDSALAEAERLREKLLARRHELEEEERRRREAAAEKLSAEVLALHERLKRLRVTASQLEKMGADERMTAELKGQGAEFEKRIKFLIQLLGYDPIERMERVRRSSETVTRLMQAVKTATCAGELRSVANELRQALSFLDIDAAQEIAQQIEEHRFVDASVEEPLSVLEAEISVVRREREDPEWAARRAEKEQKEQERKQELRKLSAQIGDLLQEITDGENYLSYLSQEEVFHQICIWAGRARLYQDRKQAVAPASNNNASLIRVFGILTRLSKELRPGHCPALDRSEERDWQTFVDKHRTGLISAQDKIQRATVAKRAHLRKEETRKAREEERRIEGQRALGELRTWLADTGEPQSDAEADEFRTRVVECLRFLPPSQELLVELVRPYSNLVTQGREFRALRRALGLRVSDAESQPPAVRETLTDELREMAAECRSRWEGRRIAIVGGRRRPDVESQLEELLKPDNFRWVEVADGKMGGVGSLEQSVRSGGTHLVLVLVDFVGHNLHKLEETCKAAGVPYRFVTKGCGLRVILEAIPCEEQKTP